MGHLGEGAVKRKWVGEMVEEWGWEREIMHYSIAEKGVRWNGNNRHCYYKTIPLPLTQSGSWMNGLHYGLLRKSLNFHESLPQFCIYGNQLSLFLIFRSQLGPLTFIFPIVHKRISWACDSAITILQNKSPSFFKFDMGETLSGVKVWYLARICEQELFWLSWLVTFSSGTDL